MSAAIIDRFDKVEVKMDKLEERFSLLEESSSVMRVIMERIGTRTDQIPKAGNENTLIYHYIVDNFLYSCHSPTIVVKSALHCRCTFATVSFIIITLPFKCQYIIV